MALVFLTLLALLLTQFAVVSATNFGGYDEWLIRWLTTRGIVGSPYSNRPFNFLWTLPGGWLTPHGFLGYHIAHVVYLWLAGCGVFWIARRLMPGEPWLAYLGGVFATLWAPSDLARLSSTQMSICSGFAFSMILWSGLFLESWLRRDRMLLVLAAFGAWISVRGYEATLPVLLAASFAVCFGPSVGRSPKARWLVVWLGALAIAAAQAVLPLAHASGEVSYQSEVWGGLDLNPVRLTGRVIRQLGFHLLPLVRLRLGELITITAALSAGVLAAASLSLRRVSASEPGMSRIRLAVLAGSGLILAVLGHSVFVLSAAEVGATRMQFFSAPGIAVFLAATIRWLASWFPPRWRVAASVGLGAFVVATAAGRTVAMQHAWDQFNLYPGQRSTLRQLTDLAPDLEAGTLVVLIDGSRSWPSTFGFRHAIEIMYPDRATGYVSGALPLLYPTTFDAEGITTVPWPSIQRGWGVGVTHHTYLAVIVFRSDTTGRLALLDEWPSDLPPLSSTAGYAPRSRILPLRRKVEARALLAR